MVQAETEAEIARIRDYLTLARLTRQANRLYRDETGERPLLFPELRRTQMMKLLHANSKAIGAAIAGALVLGIESLFPSLGGTEELTSLEVGIGAVIVAAIVWLFPANKKPE